ncbi:AAA family ATPase [Aliivibrio fischeri]|uniref:AAA family ATPase n=1 Tax=Aliivibrio fischeri TaxID=668 RepID=UPI0020B2715E|nr:AAA family ATPase [Aliivibrio fischeri]
MARDNTKYRFEESVYGKGRLVHAVVATYIERYDATLAQLEQIFPGSLQNKNGNVFITQQEYDERLSKSSDVENRFYNKAEDRLLTHDGITIYVSNQWGVGNIEAFYQQAINQGFAIEKILSSSQATLEPFFTASNENTMSPLNQILYGPPGTGKTYHTIETAVKAAEPTFTWTTRDELKAEYTRLVADKRIRFVTFHQSYGYEEFVEGLSATTNEEGHLTYPIRDGIFKSIVEDAKSDSYRKAFEVNQDARIWKISIDGTGKSDISEYCLQNGIAAIGWGESGDLLSEKLEENEYYQSLGPQVKSSLSEFAQRAAIGDLVLCIGSQRTVQAIGVISGEYKFEPAGTSYFSYYCNQLPVNWLVTDVNIDFHELNGSVNFTQKTFYELWRFSVADVFNLLERENISISSEVNKNNQDEKYVLIIDEINRGNISKIFGELITLIEPSKRKGAEEEIELVLPYSGKALSVPDNLHIIGTMNTADRSLAMMDTALRRRFDFIEMMPKPELFNNKQIKGIDLTWLLNALNKRIEALYDREHTLGHAFLFPAYNEQDEDKAFELLKVAFKNKIIPLLEEYFYDDWNKIRLVLGDNQKSDELRFVKEHNESYDSLFGSEHGLETYEESKTRYTLMAFDGENSVWDNPQAYIAVYASIK